MSLIYSKACSDKFVLYLYENGLLDQNYAILKERAKELYQPFRLDNQLKINASSIIYHSIRRLKRRSNKEILQFTKKDLDKLLANRTQIEREIQKRKNAVPRVLVNQNVAFRNFNPPGRNSTNNRITCETCNVNFDTAEQFAAHCQSEAHQFQEKVRKILQQRRQQKLLECSVEGVKDIQNILITKTAFTLTVKNMSGAELKITSIMYRRVNCIDFSNSQTNIPIILPRRKTIQFKLMFLNQNYGELFYFPIIFNVLVNDKTKSQAFELYFHKHHKILDSLQPTEPYKPLSKPAVKEMIEQVVEGLPLSSETKKSKQYYKMLAKFDMPKNLMKLLNSGLKEHEWMDNNQKNLLAEIKNLLNVSEPTKCLNENNYRELLRLLLYIEEHQMKVDIRSYDRYDEIKKIRNPYLLQLNVPGLAENRPSLIRGDSVYAKKDENDTILYQGVVHKIEDTNVLLGFNEKFVRDIFIEKQKYYISFGYNRFTLRVQHQALEYLKSNPIEKIFFAKTIPDSNIINENTINWFDRHLMENPKQRQAVRYVLSKSSKPYPYIIFGPPGTGKTLTVVECIKQIIHRDNKSKVLICASSNSAVDEVIKRLIPNPEIFRYFALSCAYDSIATEILPYANYSNREFYTPTKEELTKKRILAVTLATASRLLNMDIVNCFDYVFIDESGHATETETLVPISGINSKNSQITAQIVLAGDPRQLGPIINSPLAKQYGFDISMLERIMNHQLPYQRNADGYNPKMITKLTQNYRSHPAIIAKPKEFFYDDELEACGDHMINIALNWEGLPNKKFPLIFHNVEGRDQREGNSPSYFNLQEVKVVHDYLERLIGTKMGGVKIVPKHIAVISPYRRQVQKISKLCNKLIDQGLTVGTVEQLQGQERLIVIISTVRTSIDLLKFDKKFCLGFLRNPKRFNVAVTRAKTLLIVVGHAGILKYDEHWNKFLKYCLDNHACVGGPGGQTFNLSPLDERITQMLAELNLHEAHPVEYVNRPRE